MQKTSQGDTSRTIPTLDYSVLKDLKPATRSSPTSDCLICKIGRSTPFNNKEHCMPSISPGRPPTTQNVQTPIRLCPTCLTQIGCGKPHDCSISTRLENLKGIIDVSPPKMDEHVAVSIIENKFDMSSKKPLLFNRV